MAAEPTIIHAPNTTMNKVMFEDSAAHDWYRFVLSYPPHLVRHYLEKFGLVPGATVLDPFCGAGTTIVEAKKQRIGSIGVESHPMTCFASAVKVDWSPDPGALLQHAESIAEIALERLEADGVFDSVQRAMFEEDLGNFGVAQLRSLPADMQKLLLKDSLSPRPMHKALVLANILKEHEHSELSGHERLAFAKTLVFSSSNLNFGPEVGIGKPKLDAEVVRPWLNNVRVMAADLEALQSDWMGETSALAIRADSRALIEWIPAASVDAVICSPPYPNEKDYTRTTRLESVMLDFIRTKEELRAVKKGLVRSNTRTVYKEDQDDRFIAGIPEIQRIADEIESRRLELGKNSGFERLYPRVTKLYFGGMARHFADLRHCLKPGAQLAYVVGDQASYLRVMIRTGELLAQIAERLGYEVTGLDLFRTRLSTATREQLREEVVVLRWPGNGEPGRI
ncbi:DNA methyltransferase [soil metagenome]